MTALPSNNFAPERLHAMKFDVDIKGPQGMICNDDDDGDLSFSASTRLKTCPCDQNFDP